MTQFEEQLQLEPSGYLPEMHGNGLKEKQLIPLNVADSYPVLHLHDVLVGVMGVHFELLPQPPFSMTQGFG